MADPTVLEMEQYARAQPQHWPFDPVTGEIDEEAPAEQPQQPSNDPAPIEEAPAAQTQQLPYGHIPLENEEAPRIDPKLLRAIADGDLISFKKNLGIEKAPTTKQIMGCEILVQNAFGKGPRGSLEQNSNYLLQDPEGITGLSNNRNIATGNYTNQNHLQGVTYGRNNALHVVAGVMETLPKVISPKGKLFILSLYASSLVLYILPLLGGQFEPVMLLMGLYIYIFFLSQDQAEQKFLTAACLIISYFLTFKIFRYVHKKIFRYVGRSLLGMIYLGFILSLVFGLIPKNEKFQDTIFKLHIWYARVTIAMFSKFEECDHLPWWLKLFQFWPTIRILYKRRPYLDIAKILLQHNKDMLSARNSLMETPLHCAAKAGKHDMVSLLIKFARDESQQKLEEVLRARNKQGETALHEAARSGYCRVVNKLLDADGNLASVEDDFGISSLYLAAASGSLDVVHTLIKIDGDHPISYVGADDKTALHAAVMRKDGKLKLYFSMMNRMLFLRVILV
jgi:Ankyrin repeats (3 copies)